MNLFLDKALEAARAAVTPVMGYFRGQFRVETKADDTPVTVADREAEQVIRGVLSDAFPDHAIYGEEFGTHGTADPASADHLWLIDPIDGTKSFVRGQGVFSTQIALMQQGELVLGVSSAPAMGELAWAAAGEGAWLEDALGRRPLAVSTTRRVKDCSLSTGNLSTLAGGSRWPILGQLVKDVMRTRGYGDFYHYHRLAEGQIDAVLESDVNILDIAALAVIVREAGGVFTDLDGRAVGLSTTSVLAAPSALHAQLLQRFNP